MMRISTVASSGHAKTTTCERTWVVNSGDYLIADFSPNYGVSCVARAAR